MSRRVLVISPGAAPPGGGAGVLAWMLEALREEHRVTLLTLAPPDLAALDRHFGTRLAAGGLQLRRGRGVAWRGPFRLALLEQHLLCRAARRIAPEYEVVLACANEVDVGRRCIQYVHFPWMFLPRPGLELRWYHRLPGALGLYRRLCRRLSGYTVEGMKRNLTLVNSHWTGERMVTWYGPLELRVVPPPVTGEFPAVPWAERRDAFVAIGRISPEKRLERILDILAVVRARGWPVGLSLVGPRQDSAYARALDRRASGLDWVSWHQDLSRDQLSALVARHRYGIHAMEEEHFGIAVAEMARAGCVVFAHRSGGPAEILGDDPDLLFDGIEDAVERIVAVLAEPARREGARRRLAARAERYSTAAFVATIRELVAGWPAALD